MHSASQQGETIQSLHSWIEKRREGSDVKKLRRSGSSLRSVLKEINEKYKSSNSDTKAETSVKVSDGLLAADKFASRVESVEEKQFIHGLKRKIAFLRHAFRQSDASASGVVNGAEFKSTLMRTG